MKVNKENIQEFIDKFNFAKFHGLIPCVTQDYQTGQVLMVGFQNEEALGKTLETGIVHYYSRTRQELWKKGRTSGHVQEVKEIYGDCDLDTILVKVKQNGRACHVEGQYSCFFNQLKNDGIKVLDKDPKYM
ncbi:MAG: phosphoribosyl-AMP cyclohydrolase [Candidatus Hodarchaeota archaeon]